MLMSWELYVPLKTDVQGKEMTGPDDELGALLASGKLTPELAALAKELASGAGYTAEGRAWMADILSAYLRHPEWEPLIGQALEARTAGSTVVAGDPVGVPAGKRQ